MPAHQAVRQIREHQEAEAKAKAERKAQPAINRANAASEKEVRAAVQAATRGGLQLAAENEALNLNNQGYTASDIEAIVSREVNAVLSQRMPHLSPQQRAGATEAIMNRGGLDIAQRMMQASQFTNDPAQMAQMASQSVQAVLFKTQQRLANAEGALMQITAVMGRNRLQAPVALPTIAPSGF